MTTAFPFLSATGMVLAAGFGKRMQPLTLTTPKPLLKVGGRAMLDLAIDHLKAAGITRVVVNAHYLADQVAAHCAGITDSTILLSREDEILETGGGVKKALRAGLFQSSSLRAQRSNPAPRVCAVCESYAPWTRRGWIATLRFASLAMTKIMRKAQKKSKIKKETNKPFFVLAGDMPMTEGAAPALARLAQAWNPKTMDVLLLVMPRDKARGFSGKGDFMMRADGSLARAGVGGAARDVVFISAMIVNPVLYDEVSEPAFSNNVIFDLAESRGRLFGLVHDGACYHVGTPEDLAEANRLLETGEGWR